MGKTVYSKEELYQYGSQRCYGREATEAAFLLGGIGTGNFSIGARGELRDWEIFNRPGKGVKLPYTFFAIRTETSSGKVIAKVLESQIVKPFSKSHGFHSSEVAGLPRLKDSVLKGEYPFAQVDFSDDELPVKISLEAYTPLIPLNPEDSGIPCGILKYRIGNISKEPVKFTVMGSIMNAVGFSGTDKFGNVKSDFFTGNKNEFRKQDGLAGLYLYSDAFCEDDVRYGSMALSTFSENVTVKTNWLEGGWWDGIHDLWDDFCNDGILEESSSIDAVDCALTSPGPRPRYGSIGVFDTLKPGETKEITFYITWYFPNRVKSWWDNCKNNCSSMTVDCCSTPVVKLRYSRKFKNAWEVALYLLAHSERLETQTRAFHRALFSSTLPDYVIDAVASNITVLRSTTCFWLENGTFAGYEGCFDDAGCCHGSCTHVWNYAQTLAFLFPSLERSMREVEFNSETDESGRMSFRTNTIFGDKRWDFHPAADGQMGTIIRLYREWKISGDNDFLKKVWDGAKRALDYAFEYWDSDGDFVLDSQQHNTYDIEFYGPNSMVNSMFFAALKAGAEMAAFLGDSEREARYRNAFEKGSKRMDELLWNGDYYIQKVDDVNRYKYQYGNGCLSDQLLGQMLSHVTGLGYILPEDHVKKAVKSIFEHNFLTDFSHHHNVQRTYVLNDEKGLLLCSWPKGGRPKLPFVYCDEVWTGIEYQVASHLIYEGFIDEGLTIVKAVRERHDGYRRNPWNEVECGHHYVRSMSSWAVLLALSGYQCDMVNKVIKFSPKINENNFSTFWSTGTAWGIYTQKLNKETGKIDCNVEVLYGSLEGVKVITPTGCLTL